MTEGKKKTGEYIFHINRQALTAETATRWHGRFEINIVLSDDSICVLNGAGIPVQKGDLVFLTPLDVVKYKKNTDIISIVFSAQLIEHELAEHLHTCCIMPGVDMSMVQRLFYESKNNSLLYKTYVENILNSILIDIVRFLFQNQKAGSPFLSSECIQKALIYLKNNFREGINLSETARHVGLSATYFSRLFHELTGKTFQSHLSSLRLDYAAGLLINSTLSVTEICYSSGYNSFSHFLRAFKEKYSLSPGKYRQNAKCRTN